MRGVEHEIKASRPFFVPNRMDIKTAEFTLSAPRVSMCPNDTKPEYAFIGRSNVGKSSLINMLARNKKLAKTSSTPGKTLLINHFLINREWYLVDLPGYGFAKRSKTEVAKLDQIGIYQLVGCFFYSLRYYLHKG